MRGWRKALAVPRLARRLRELSPDVVHVHLLAAQLWGIPAARLARVPVVVSSEHSLMADSIEGRPLSPWLRRVYLTLERLADHTVAVSATTAERLVAWGVPRGRISVVDNGIDVDGAQPATGDRERVRAELDVPRGSDRDRGRRSPGPGQAGRRDPRGRRARLRSGGHVLLVAGAGSLRDALASQARSLGVDAAVRWLGARDDVPAVLAASDVLVSASRDETFGLAVLEAVAGGLPAVFVQCPALEELGALPDGTERADGGGPEASPRGPRPVDARGLGRRPVPPGVRERYDVRATAAALDSLHERLLQRTAGGPGPDVPPTPVSPRSSPRSSPRAGTPMGAGEHTIVRLRPAPPRRSRGTGVAAGPGGPRGRPDRCRPNPPGRPCRRTGRRPRPRAPSSSATAAGSPWTGARSGSPARTSTGSGWTTTSATPRGPPRCRPGSGRRRLPRRAGGGRNRRPHVGGTRRVRPLHRTPPGGVPGLRLRLHRLRRGVRSASRPADGDHPGRQLGLLPRQQEDVHLLARPPRVVVLLRRPCHRGLPGVHHALRAAREPVHGTAYRDDPTIMAWETGNEMWCQTCSGNYWDGSWTKAVADHIAAVAPKQLVVDGHGTDPACRRACLHEPSLDIASVDIVDDHFYPMQLDRVRSSAQRPPARQGLPRRGVRLERSPRRDGLQPFLDAVRDSGAAGALTWSVVPHADTAGFVDHDDGFQYFFPGRTADERARTSSLQKFAVSLGGAAPVDRLPPAPCALIVGRRPEGTDCGGEGRRLRSLCRAAASGFRVVGVDDPHDLGAGPGGSRLGGALDRQHGRRGARVRYRVAGAPGWTHRHVVVRGDEGIDESLRRLSRRTCGSPVRVWLLPTTWGILVTSASIHRRTTHRRRSPTAWSWTPVCGGPHAARQGTAAGLTGRRPDALPVRGGRAALSRGRGLEHRLVTVATSGGRRDDVPGHA